MTNAVVLHLSNGNEIAIPKLITERCLTQLLDLPSVILGSATPLKNGEVLRHFHHVCVHDRLLNLAIYSDVFLPDHTWLGQIQKTVASTFAPGA
jgi:hypothetical protein